MATFKQLQDLVKANVIDLPPAVANEVPGLINKAVRALQRQRTFKVMEAAATFNTTVATRALGTMPSDFKEWRTDAGPYYRTQDGQAVFVDLLGSEDDALRRFTYDDPDDKGAPRSLTWAVTGATGAVALSVWPLPDGLSDWTVAPAGEYRLVVPYARYLPDLVADADTNWFAANAEEWIEYTATAWGFQKDWDEARAAMWFQLAAAKFVEVVRLDKALRVSAVNVLPVRSHVLAHSLQVRF